MISFLRRVLKRVPFARTTWHAVRPKSRIERIEARDCRLTTKILRRVVGRDSFCVDVGAHTGEVLNEMRKLAPGVRHLAIEAIPLLADALSSKFPGLEVVNVALSDQTGEATFHWVENNPAFSGLVARPDLRPVDRVVPIKVRIVRLDDLVAPGRRVGLLKVDVEGGELGVFRGAARMLGESRPWVLFEHGSAAAAYGATSADLFAELARHRLAIWRLDHWLAGRPALTATEFAALVAEGDWWNWLAGPALETSR